MRMNAMAAGLVVAAGTIGTVGAVMGQGMGPGAPYRIATVDEGREEVSPRGHSFVAWGSRVAVAYEGAKGGAVGVYDPGTGAFEEIVNGLEMAPDGPYLLGEAGGRMVFAAYAPGVGMELVAIGLDGSVAPLGVVAGEIVMVEQWGAAAGRVLLSAVDYVTFERRIWETDGTAEGTRAVELGQDAVGSAWAFGSRVLYVGMYGELLAYDVVSGEREVVLASREYGPEWMWLDGGRGVFGRGNEIYETDGTAAGTRRIEAPGRVERGWFVLVGTRLAYETEAGAMSVERSGGAPELLVEGEGLLGTRSGPALVISRRTETSVQLWLSDGTAAGTEPWMTRTGQWPLVSTLGDGTRAGFVQISSWMGEVEFFRTDGTVRGTERLPVTLGAEYPYIVGGSLYFGLAPVELGETGMYVIGERGGVQRVADPRWTQTIGFSGAEGIASGAGRGWIGRRREDGGRSLWSVSGAAGDLVESPCAVCGGNWFVWWAEAPRGMTALVADEQGVQRFVAVGNEMGGAGEAAETLHVMSGTRVSLASGLHGAAAFDGRAVVVTDGTAVGTRTFELEMPDDVLADVISVGSWFAVVATWDDESWRRYGRVWAVGEAGMIDLGTIEIGGTPKTFAGRLYWTTRNGELMMTDGATPLAAVGRGEAPWMIGESNGRGITRDWDGEAGVSVLKLVDPADIAFASMVEVARVDAWVRRAFGVGGRIVAEAGHQLGDLVAVEPGTGRTESLGFEAAWVVGEARVGGREALVVREVRRGREGFWVTDGTAAGTREVSAGREDITGLDRSGGAAVVGGRLVVVAAAEDGPQVFAVNLCAADQDGDGMWTDEDYTAFVLGFEAGASSADVNADGFVDMFDYMDYLTAMEMGC